MRSDYDLSGLDGVATIRTLASAASTATDAAARRAHVTKARALLDALVAELAQADRLVAAQERELAHLSAGEALTCSR